MKSLYDTNLPDVQSSLDPRNIPIEYVGIRGVQIPVTVQGQNGIQPTVATIDMYVALPAQQKGTHMSRFLGLLKQHQEPLCQQSLVTLMDDMLAALNAPAGRIDFDFPFFVLKAAPVSKLESLLNYRVQYRVEHKNGKTEVIQTVIVPVTSLCPCSKEISRFGAHNQRSHITISAKINGELSLEQQIRYAEQSASCELWSQLKRVDEKYVTETAYENPKFVEDLIRDVAVALNADANIVAYRVKAENFESIHNHSAYAQITKGDI
ncbi:MAG TPA: GTP cyclohydrolase I FolE2 [Candidatus Aphodousia gallistercoris]|nr:GTP cyclohydrolase I FolE2 [Candidatus Aphodousia gallistercoris]